ncbi:hypothetical protein GCM10010174_79020 [Kutzneria viridogrisea]|uniref:NYN domain-containing protein n=2 Tax=Kutzneria TaxID=43356 RepID=W5WC25_9PSEU|nr:hypothetical protein [Kutzneria albida]AHH98708.1 hypothetical protein KALB_5346 [Kutzneria albida DSM 43870]MBA8923779.1 hypothetical protein [Kutzneria viridogrisea]
MCPLATEAEHTADSAANEQATRVLLIDLENLLGSIKVRERALRASLEVLRATAGAEVHHTVAGYAVPDGEPDPIASLLAEYQIGPLRTSPHPDAADHVLLHHARRLHHGRVRNGGPGLVFLVASADRRFSELAEHGRGRLEVLACDGQPVAARLIEAAQVVHRMPRPVAGAFTFSTQPAGLAGPAAAPALATDRGALDRGLLKVGIIAGLVAGVSAVATRAAFDALYR